jgi:hypothetical protein
MAAAAAAAASSTLLRASNISVARPVPVAAGQQLVPSGVACCIRTVSGRRAAAVRAAAAGDGTAPAGALPAALLFDCDGVLVDTEKDGHRISFNETFAEVRFLPSILSLIYLHFPDAAAPPTLIFSVVSMLLVI